MGSQQSKQKEEEKIKLKEEEEKKQKEEEEKRQDEKETLLEVAVRFLGNPKVADATEHQKKIFLKKKGLSNDDIKIAFERFEKQKEKENEKKSQVQPSNPGNQTLDPANLDSQQNNNLVQLSLESQIEKAKTTNFLSLKNQKLTELDPSIFQLTNLTTLILSNNNLGQIPQQITQLTNLQTLHLSNCNLDQTNFPPNLNFLQLKELIISKNQITDISFLTSIKSIENLDASENQITFLPENLKQLENLKILNVRHNNISKLDSFIIEIPKLEKLLVSGNNLDKLVVSALQSGGLQGLKQYFKENDF